MIPAIQVKVNDRQLRQTLEKLAPRLNERARKTGARRALAPYVKQIAALWQAAPYKGKPLHRRAIASAAGPAACSLLHGLGLLVLQAEGLVFYGL